MSASHILDLNDDCLLLVLEQLSGEDQTCFGQVCQRFRELFIALVGSQHRRFTLDKNSSRQQLIRLCICSGSVEELVIDVDHFDTSRAFRSYGCVAPTNCFSILISALTRMSNLNRLVVKQVDYLLTPIEQPFDEILRAVKDLSELKFLELKAIKDFSYEHLGQLKHLEELRLLVKHINGATLASCCKSSRNLRCLQLGFSSIEHSLSNIVPHCANLEVLHFGIISDASAYKPLAKLPKLKQLIYFGVRRSGSFLPLLKDLAARSQLQRLDIDGGTLSPEETQQVVRISTLQQLKCFCSTAESVEKLAQLPQLQQLSLWMCCGADISAALLKIVAQCQQLKRLSIAAGNLTPDFMEAASKQLFAASPGPEQRALRLELPMKEYTHPIKKTISQGNTVLDCAQFELASWKDLGTR